MGRGYQNREVESSKPGTKIGRIFSTAATIHEPAGSIW